MNFTTTLFKALEAAHQVACDCVPVANCAFGTNALLQECVQMQMLDGADVVFYDQAIEVGPGGAVQVHDVEGARHNLALIVHTGLQECHIGDRELPEDAFICGASTLLH